MLQVTFSVILRRIMSTFWADVSLCVREWEWRHVSPEPECGLPLCFVSRATTPADEPTFPCPLSPRRWPRAQTHATETDHPTDWRVVPAIYP